MLKRLLLAIPVAFVATASSVKDLAYITWFAATGTSISCVIILWNFPVLTKIMHLKPTYFEDLEDDRQVDSKTKTRFQNYFTLISTVFLSCVVGTMAFYTSDRIHDTPLTPVELVGMLGGGISLYGKCQDKIGRILLASLTWVKNRHFSPAIELTDYPKTTTQSPPMSPIQQLPPIHPSGPTPPSTPASPEYTSPTSLASRTIFAAING
jgi:hypothetical protein